MFPLQGGNPVSAPLYSDDVFSAYTYTGNGATQTINNGIALASTASWGSYQLASPASLSGYAVVEDGSGNFYVNGGNSNESLTVKYNSSGTFLWQRKLAGCGSPSKITIDSSGNVYLVGYITIGWQKTLIVKYNTNGVLQWQRILALNPSTGSNYGLGVATDGSGNVYATGISNDGTSNYALIAKYNSSGVIQWQRLLQENQSSGEGIATDSSGNVYVTGSASDTSAYTFIAKYNSSGAIQWQRKLQQTSGGGKGIVTDSSNNVYVTGRANDGSDYILIAKYNTSGVIQWQRKLKQGASVGYGIATDSSGAAYITGNANDGGDYFLVAKYNTSGAMQWQRKLKFKPEWFGYGYGIATNTVGNLYVTGAYFDGTNNNFITSKLLQDGTTISGTAIVTMTEGTATDSAGTATDSAGTATDSAGTATDSAGTATYTYGAQVAVVGQGGLVWTKSRSTTANNCLHDTVRGVSAGPIYSNLTNRQYGGELGVTSFSANGYSLSSNTSFNGSGSNYVGWTFAKAPKFFDVVTYTGTGASRTIAHTLGVAPGMIIIKRTTDAADWWVWHRTFGANEYVLLNSTAAKSTGANSFTSSDASGFTIGSESNINGVSNSYVAYLFAHDTSADGIVQCGSFSSTSPVTLNWEPQYLLYKRSSGVEDWQVADTARGFNSSNDGRLLFPNLSSAEQASGGVPSIQATGFTPSFNGASQTYIYLAIRRPNKPPTTGTQVYNAIARTGTGAAATVTGVGFAPDLLINDSRSGTTGAWFEDRLRGATLDLTSATTAAETTVAQAVTAFNMDGASIGTNTNWNTNAATYINWFFKRAPGVFDEVCGSSDGAGGWTFPHNLAATPEFVITKQRNSASVWMCFGSVLPSLSYRIQLQATTAAEDTGVSNTMSASSVTVGAGRLNFSGTYVAYLFATKAGISKVFSYTGNGSSQTINCGFTTGARWVMIKRTDSTGDWFVWDSTRGIIAANDPHLSLNTTAAEVTTDDSVDTDTTGFIVNQVAATNINVTSATYIYLSFA